MSDKPAALAASDASHRGRRVWLQRAAGSFWIRVVVTIALLAVLGIQIDWHTAAQALRTGSWGWFAAGVAAVEGALFVGAVRWHLFLEPAGISVARGKSVRAYWIGAFLNSVLPTSFGGDAARAWLVAPSRSGVARAFTTVVVERVGALLCLFALAWVCVAVDPAGIPGRLVAALGLASIAIVALGAILNMLRRRPWTERTSPRTRLAPLLGEGREAVAGILASRKVLVETAVLGVLFQVLMVGALVCLARTIDVELSFTLAAVAAPLVLLITLIPLSVGGFGIREGGFVLVLGSAHIPATDAALLSLLTVAAMTIAALPGGFALLRRTVRVAQPESA